MSDFNCYAKEVDNIAKEAFAEYKTAEQNLSYAEELAKNYPVNKSGTSEYQAKAARYQAELAEARLRVEQEKEKLRSYNDDVQKIRERLVKVVNARYGANPEDVDANTVTLIQSGILTAADYVTLIDRAVADNNVTMARLLAKSAEELAKTISETDEREGTKLRLKAYSVQNITGREYIETFDQLADVFRRCTNNPFMINEWDNLTAETIKTF